MNRFGGPTSPRRFRRLDSDPSIATETSRETPTKDVEPASKQQQRTSPCRDGGKRIIKSLKERCKSSPRRQRLESDCDDTFSASETVPDTAPSTPRQRMVDDVIVTVMSQETAPERQEQQLVTDYPPTWKIQPTYEDDVAVLSTSTRGEHKIDRAQPVVDTIPRALSRRDKSRAIQNITKLSESIKASKKTSSRDELHNRIETLIERVRRLEETGNKNEAIDCLDSNAKEEVAASSNGAGERSSTSKTANEGSNQNGDGGIKGSVVNEASTTENYEDKETTVVSKLGGASDLVTDNDLGEEQNALSDSKEPDDVATARSGESHFFLPVVHETPKPDDGVESLVEEPLSDSSRALPDDRVENLVEEPLSDSSRALPDYRVENLVEPPSDSTRALLDVIDKSHMIESASPNSPAGPTSHAQTSLSSSVASLSSFGIPGMRPTPTPVFPGRRKTRPKVKQPTAHSFFWRTHPRETFLSYQPNRPKTMLSPLRESSSSKLAMIKTLPKHPNTRAILTSRTQLIKKEPDPRVTFWSEDIDPVRTPPRVKRTSLPLGNFGDQKLRERTVEIQAPGQRLAHPPFPEVPFPGSTFQGERVSTQERDETAQVQSIVATLYSKPDSLWIGVSGSSDDPFEGIA